MQRFWTCQQKSLCIHALVPLFEPKKLVSSSGWAYAGLGFEFVAMFLACAAFGHWIDSLFWPSKSWALLGGIFLGLFAGLYHVLLRTREMETNGGISDQKTSSTMESTQQRIQRLQSEIEDVSQKLEETFPEVSSKQTKVEATFPEVSSKQKNK